MKPHLFRTIVFQEWRQIRRGYAFRVFMVLLALMILFAVQSGTSWTERERATLAEIGRHDAERYQYFKNQLADLDRRGNPRPEVKGTGTAWYLFQPGGAVAPAPHIDPLHTTHECSPLP